ncbi:MAG: hypothetical protein GVY18_00640, partial [Bacteroidetes bacterium]|nr:hypothetical protein [Bacteroidota bacterium]
MLVLLLLATGLAPVNDAKAQVSITQTSSPDVFFLDTKNGYPGGYVSFDISTTSSYSDLWVEASGFSSTGTLYLGLAPNEDGCYEVGSLNNETKPAFLYFAAPSLPNNIKSTNVDPQSYELRAYDGKPSSCGGSGTLVGSPQTYTYNGNADYGPMLQVTQANASKIASVSISTTTPLVGTTITVTAQGNTGNVGAPQVVAYSPANQLNWNADAFKLVGSVVTFPNGESGDLVDDLFTTLNVNGAGYQATYTFEVVAPTSEAFPIAPLTHTASGTQTKHPKVDPADTSIEPVPPAVEITVEKLVDVPSDDPDGGFQTFHEYTPPTTDDADRTVTYRLIFSASDIDNTNISPPITSVLLDHIVDVLPQDVSYVGNPVATATDENGNTTNLGNISPTTQSGSIPTSFCGITNPSPLLGSQLEWSDGYSIPENGNITLEFDALISLAAAEDQGRGEFVNLAFAVDEDAGSFDELACDNAAILIPQVLPVELTSFDATVDGEDVILRWATASETNNAGFDVQVLDADGAAKSWSTLAFVDGHGTTTEPRSYHHRTATLEAGTHTFRLKQIDFDGAFEYSPEVEVVIGLPEQYVVEPAYPNPFNPEATLRFAV